MAFRPSAFGVLVYTEEGKARQELSALVVKVGVVAAAAELGVDRHTVQRWMRRLGLDPSGAPVEKKPRKKRQAA